MIFFILPIAAILGRKCPESISELFLCVIVGMRSVENVIDRVGWRC